MMQTKLRALAVGSSLSLSCMLLVGCGAPSEPAEVGAYPVNAGAPADGSYPEVVTFRFRDESLIPKGANCTATKIGAGRYLTAAHCVRGMPRSGEPLPSLKGINIYVTNQDVLPALSARYYSTSAVMSGPAWYSGKILGVYVHPTYDADLNNESEDMSYLRSDDLAVLETTADIPSAPVAVLDTNPSVVASKDDPSVRGTFVGYGLDFVGGGGFGTKRVGAAGYFGDPLIGIPDGEFAEYRKIRLGRAAMVLTYSGPGNQQTTAAGDSGGPHFMGEGPARTLVAVTSSGTSSQLRANDGRLVMASATPVAPARAWIDHPHNGTLPLVVGARGQLGSLGLMGPKDAPGDGRQCFRDPGADALGGDRPTAVVCRGMLDTTWEVLAADSDIPEFVLVRNAETGRCLALRDGGEVGLEACQSRPGDGLSAQHWRGEVTEGHLRIASRTGAYLGASEAAMSAASTSPTERSHGWLLFR